MLRTETVAVSSDPRIAREYARFLTTRAIVDAAKARVHDARSRAFLKDAFERWLLSNANFASESGNVFRSRQSGSQIREIDDIFVSDMVLLQVMSEDDAHSLLQTMIADVEVSGTLTPEQAPGESATINVGPRAVTIRYGAMARSIARDRYEALVAKGSQTDIVVLCLRYGSIISSSNHWSMPAASYEYANATYAVRLEGFASPFNSQLMLLDSTAQFCSLFPDTDAVFGSVGSFFQTQLAGQSVIINPPYVGDIMDEAARRCVEACEYAEKIGAPTRLFLTLSDRKNSQYYHILSQSRFTRLERTLRPFEHFYEDTSVPGEAGKRIVAEFPTLIFALSAALDDHQHDYSDVWSRMSLPYPARIRWFAIRAARRGKRELNRLLARS